MSGKVLSIGDALAALTEPWMPTDLARANDTVVRVVRLHGDFPWHHHREDEMFLCWEGSFRIEMRGQEAVVLNAGDVFVVPGLVEHRPIADSPASALLFEPANTQQYGDQC